MLNWKSTRTISAAAGKEWRCRLVEHFHDIRLNQTFGSTRGSGGGETKGWNSIGHTCNNQKLSCCHSNAKIVVDWSQNWSKVNNRNAFVQQASVIQRWLGLRADEMASEGDVNQYSQRRPSFQATRWKKKWGEKLLTDREMCLNSKHTLV